MKKTVETSGWSQMEKNLIHAATSSLLAEQVPSITHKGIGCINGDLDVDSPSKDPLLVLTDAVIRTRAALIFSTANAAAAAVTP